MTEENEKLSQREQFNYMRTMIILISLSAIGAIVLVVFWASVIIALLPER